MIWTGGLTLLITIPPRAVIQPSQRSYPCLVRPPSLDWDPVRETAAPKMMGDPVLGAVPALDVPQAASRTASPAAQTPTLAPRMALIYRTAVPPVTDMAWLDGQPARAG